jgi:uncharacterized membrane protein AbrB (regulator of aidB expression)
MTRNDEYWFVPKSYGYGATPKNWKGWAATAAFAIVTIGLALSIQLVFVTRLVAQWPLFIALWLAAIIVSIVGFVILCRAKTEGDWRWRWGKSDQ